jgi:hypothetical protein
MIEVILNIGRGKLSFFFGLCASEEGGVEENKTFLTSYRKY